MPRPLGPEPWGAKLRRVRRAGGFSQRELAERIAEASSEPLSGTGYATFETLDEPSTLRQKRVAAWACAICDIDLAELGLDIEELFPTPADLRKGDTSCDDRSLRELVGAASQ